MIFIRYYIKMLKNSLEQASFAKVFKVCFFGIISVFFLAGLYFGFYRLIAYLDKLPFIGPILVYKLLSLILLTTFVMIIFSSLITSLHSLYFAKELELLMIMPLSPLRIFLIKSLESALQASWMVFVIILPFILAFARLKGLGLIFFGAAALFSVPYVLIPSYLGVFFTIFLFRVFPSHRLRDTVFVVLIIMGSCLYVLMRLIQPERLVNADMFEHVMQYVMLLQAPTAFYLPSWWLTEIIRCLAVKDIGDFKLFALLLTGTAFCIVSAAVFIGSKFYFTSFNRAFERRTRKSRNNNYLGCHRIIKGLPAKELRVFFRSTEQWPQLILLGALVLVYIFSVYRLPIDTVYLKTLISFLNIGFAGFVLSAVALRFVFPAVSIEGRAFWVIKTLPLEMKSFIFSKWKLYAPMLILPGALIVGLSCVLLGQDFFVSLFSVISIICIALGLVSLSIGFGAVFPRFGVSNVARIESSTGGIFFMITSMFYVGLVISFEAMLAQMYFQGRVMRGSNGSWESTAAVITALVFIHLTAVILPLYLGIRSLNNYEVCDSTV